MSFRDFPPLSAPTRVQVDEEGAPVIDADVSDWDQAYALLDRCYDLHPDTPLAVVIDYEYSDSTVTELRQLGCDRFPGWTWRDEAKSGRYVGVHQRLMFDALAEGPTALRMFCLMAGAEVDEDRLSFDAAMEWLNDAEQCIEAQRARFT